MAALVQTYVGMLILADVHLFSKEATASKPVNLWQKYGQYVTPGPATHGGNHAGAH